MTAIHAKRLVEQIADLKGTQAKRRDTGYAHGAHFRACRVSKVQAFTKREAWELIPRAAREPHFVKVLLVEDDASVAQMYRLKLELEGYSVDVATDGLAALEKARTLMPDVMLLDIRLPKLDGLGVLEALRADPITQGIRVVMLSNWNEKELVERGMKLGALDHLLKSQTTPARLARRVQELLEGPEV